ncbi:MAG: YihY/virulence factor BrkB family protein [Anaerolineae bacterium]
MDKLVNRVTHWAEETFERLNEKTDGALGTIRGALDRYAQVRAGQAAASLAFYAFFSLFPLLLVLVFVGSFFVTSQVAFRQVLTTLSQVLPISQEVIEGNLREVLEIRGTLGGIGIVSLLWSASNYFVALSDSINRAWTDAPRRNPLEQRLLAVTMLGGVILLVTLSLVANAVVALLPRWADRFLSEPELVQTPLAVVLAYGVPWSLALLTFILLYRLVPRKSPPWRAVIWSALFASVGWQVASALFTWYVGSGAAQYRLVYGSLGTIVALLFWIYLTSTITLIGAHICAAIHQHRSTKRHKTP